MSDKAEVSFNQNVGLRQRLYLSGLPHLRCAEEIARFLQRLSGRHAFSIGADGIICICAPAHGRGRRHDAHLQCGRQQREDVWQRHPLCGRVAVHPRHGKAEAAIDTLSGLKTVTRMGEKGLCR